MNSLVATLQANGQDHEFYPTTDEIIKRMIRDIRHREDSEDYHTFRNLNSILDIGAGGSCLRTGRLDRGGLFQHSFSTHNKRRAFAHGANKKGIII
jgi:uncharacterized phage protein gp47/JayE